MSDMSQTNLREPDPMNWDNYATGQSKYQAPPVPIGPDGKPIQYFVKVKPKFDEKDFGATNEGFRSYQIGPLEVVKSGTADGYKINYSYVNVKKRERNGKVVDSSSAGDFIRGAGITAKPQKNSEYDVAIKNTTGRVVPVVLDWEARNKDTGEQVSGYLAFPEDPERPGQRKAILKAGDTYNVLDAKGQPTGEKKTVTSEVLFANARVRYFRDPGKK